MWSQHAFHAFFTRLRNPKTGSSSQSWPMHYGSSLLICQQRKHINDTTMKDRNRQTDGQTDREEKDKTYFTMIQTSMRLLQMHTNSDC
jgi:hypothetical protein